MNHLCSTYLLDQASHVRNLAFGQGRKALLGTDIIGVVPVIHGDHTVLQFPDAVDDLLEEPAVVGNGNERARVIDEGLLKGAGIDASGDDAALCANADVRAFVLADLKKNNMVAPDWKGYEIAKTLILDPEEWTTDNEMLTPSFKVKLRNLLAKHDEEIQAIA